MSEKKFRARLRVRVGKALTTDKLVIVVRVAGHEVEVRSQDKNESLREAKWIVLTAGGFDMEEEARAFGEQLRVIAGIVGICTRIGIDTGEDLPTTWVNEEWARTVGLIRAEERILPNMHGLIVFPDDGLSRIGMASANATVTFDPAPLLESMNELGEKVPISIVGAEAGIRLLNLALISAEPLTQVVLAISAIEALGQEEKWTKNQKALLTRLATMIENAEGAGDEEKEVADALKRSLHRIGLRQGVLRAFNRLGLHYLKGDWDRLYATRSKVFHGTEHLSESEMHKLAQAAMALCGKVIIALLERQGVRIPAISKKHY